MVRGPAQRQGGGRCAAGRPVDALQLTASPQGPQGPQGAFWGTRDGEGPLRYGMASRLVVMGPVVLVFYGVRITPSIAFRRQVLVIAQAQPHVPTPCKFAQKGTLRGGNWHEILCSVFLFPFCCPCSPLITHDSQAG